MNPEIKNITALSAHLHGRRIGVINRLGGDRNVFSFDDEYIENARRPTMSLSFKSETGGLLTSVRPVTKRLPPFFANLLPEGHLRTYLAKRAGVNPERDFFLLAALGADLAGAVVVTPFGSGEDEAVLHESARVENRREENILRFSLAGVQLKFSAALEAAGGLTIPVDGVGGLWIIKLPSAQYQGVSENEYVMMELARAAGLDVPRTRLVSLDEIKGLPEEVSRMEGKALAVERFDRTPEGGRIHMEDFAQIFGIYPDNKYKGRSYSNIAAVLWAETDEAGTFEFVRRLVFSIMIGNGDMHLKNWSLLYPNKRTPVLSPAYDLVATLPYIPNDQLGLTFGESRSLKEITTDQIRRFVDRAGLPMKPIRDLVLLTAEQTRAAWNELEAKELLKPAVLAVIDGQIRSVVV